jgi:ABC-2 type transport system ATP-binding protein
MGRPGTVAAALAGTQELTAMSDQPVTLDAQGLGRRYGKRWAVRGVSLRLSPGETLGVVGADGAGKTTLLQMFAAILDPSEGRCTAFGWDSRQASKRIAARLGYMTQGFTLYDRLTVEENLRLAARIRGLDANRYATRREKLLTMAGLMRFTDRPAGKLSGGMRKKLSLCTNLIHEPELLILDEPGLGVDPLSRRELWNMLAGFRDSGIATVVATSYMDEAERCDRVLLLREGVPIALDTPAAVRARAAGRVFEQHGEDPMALALDLRAIANIHGVQVLPDRVRFQMSEDVALPAETVAVSVTPILEDIFVLDNAEADPATDDTPPPSSASEKPAGLETRGVSVVFGRFRAVDKVSLRIQRGELLALLGPNGAGKTTLIRALCGLVPFAEGSADVAGLALPGQVYAVRQRIGYMSQRFSLYLDLTAGENLAFFASAYGLSGMGATAAIDQAARQLGLSLERDRLVGAMSGAERQRLALACSILHAPSVLFLDEPTSGVDPVARYRFWWLIRRLAAGGMSIIVTTHYLDEAAYCDRIGLMHQGRLIGWGTLPELRQSTGAEPDASVETVFVRAIEAADAVAVAA